MAPAECKPDDDTLRTRAAGAQGSKHKPPRKPKRWQRFPRGRTTTSKLAQHIKLQPWPQWKKGLFAAMSAMRARK